MIDASSDFFARTDLSRGQALLWMGQQLHPERPIYNMALAFEIRGPLDADHFTGALDDLVASSDALRTRITERDGVPTADVADQLDGGLRRLDLSDAADPAEQARLWTQSASQELMALDQRLFDAALLRLDDDVHVFYFCQHHIIADGWSTAVCFERLDAFYRARVSGAPAAQGQNTAPQFASFVEFERAQQSTAAHAKSLAYWQSKVAAAHDPTAFYGNASAGGSRSARTDRIAVRMGAERSARLEAFIQREDVRSLTADLARFNVLATALFAFVHRVGGERNDLAILAPAHNRATAAFKNTVGLFIEVFPLHLRVDADDSLLTLLQRVQRESRDFLIHARPGTSTPDHAAGYDVLLNYIPTGFGDFGGMPTRSDWVHPDHGDPAHSLRLQVHDFDRSGELQLHFDVNCDAFGSAERASAVEHFFRILDALLDEPERSITDIELLTQPEREAKLQQFVGPVTSWPYATATAAIEARIATNPGAIAAVEQGGDRQSITYAELDARSRELAQRLVTAGVQRGDRVALVLPRSIDFVIGTLAVWRAAAAYVPIDPSFPQQRTEGVVRDSGARVVLGHGSRRGDLTTADDAPLFVALDDMPQADSALQAATEPTTALPSAAPTDLAYVIYTSGSTGKPKGVAVPQSAVAAYAQWAAATYAADGTACSAALFTSVAVDLTVTSLLVPLLTGGSVRLYPDADGPHDLSVLQVIDDDAVDLVKLTPAHLEMLQQRSGAGGVSLSRLRTMIVGGEDLRRDLALRAEDMLGKDVAIYNEYGPTEATVGCVVHRHDAERDGGLSVPIGRPIDNARVYLLDDRLRPVSAGIEGTLWIGGAGLASGYLDDDAQTAERFVSDPFVPGERIYNSGDLVREDPASGQLVYCGRRDGQVKVRGVRIELAEIETVLAKHPAVQSSVAQVIQSEPETAPVASLMAAVASGPVSNCLRCGLASNHPDAHIDDAGICKVCHEYDGYRDEAQRYFRTRDEFAAVFEEARNNGTISGKYDCMMLLSGGKDSTYTLYQLVEMGLRVLVFSLDNGYISDGAKANIKSAVDDLGVDLVFAKTPSMNEIFADSLTRFSNVCQGCFKTIYTLATNLAREHSIRFLVTGLSRGQIFETRLADFYRSGITDPDVIDRAIIAARKAYHRVDDTVSRTLDVSAFASDEVFDDIRYLDFYRYTDVPLEEMLRFLDERAPWVRPPDTGRSTNCLINDIGIHVHKRERGYHNYSLPYSWDVRLGHKTRDECLEELDDEIDEERVQQTLREVGYRGAAGAGALQRQQLVAFYVPKSDAAHAGTDLLRQHLADALPSFMMPQDVVAIDAIPLTRAGKVDRDALRHHLSNAAAERAGDDHPYVAPSTPAEAALCAIWQDVLGIDKVGVHDDFIALGGDSIQNIQVVARARQDGWKLSPREIFDHPTVAELAKVAVPETGAAKRSPQPEVHTAYALSPVQRWFVDQRPTAAEHFAQSIVLSSRSPIDKAAVEAAIVAIASQHGALRLSFELEGTDGEAPQQRILPAGTATPPAVLSCRSLVVSDDAGTEDRGTSNSSASISEAISRLETELAASFDLSNGQVLAAGILQNVPNADGEGSRDLLVLAAHHLCIDAVSWTPLLEDLDSAYSSAVRGDEIHLRSATDSWSSWVTAAADAAVTDAVRDGATAWTGMPRDALRLPLDRGDAGAPAARASDRRVQRRLSTADSETVLAAVQASPSVTLPDLLLSCIAESVRAWTGARDGSLWIELEGHGRDLELDADDGQPLDVSRTVGWFTALYPLAIPLNAAGAAATLHGVVAARGALPRPETGAAAAFGLLRTYGDEAVRAALDGLPRCGILFNHLGRTDSTLPTSTTAFDLERGLAVVHSPRARRPHLLEIDTAVHGDQIELNIVFSDQRHDAETVERLADAALDALRSTAATGWPEPTSTPKPQDFPEAELSQSDLDDLLKEFGD